MELDWELIHTTHARNAFGEDYDKKTHAWADVAKAMSVGVDHRRYQEGVKHPQVDVAKRCYRP